MKKTCGTLLFPLIFIPYAVLAAGNSTNDSFTK